MSASDPSPEEAASGVAELIGRIRDKGIEEGKREADRLLEEARLEASRVVAEAVAEAGRLLAEARARIDSERKASEEALRLAARDTVKELGAGVHSAFKRHVRRLVSAQLGDIDFLREIILAIASRTAREFASNEAVEILISRDAHGHREPGAEKASAAGEERIHDFILGISSAMLREGIEIKGSPDVASGATVKIVDEHLKVDLSEETVSEFLLHQLLPRYRRIFYSGE